MHFVQTLKVGAKLIEIIYGNNEAIGLICNGNVYYYVRDGFGNIVNILDSSYNKVVTYKYDEWGKIIFQKDTSIDSIGKFNPIRYKGYIYLEETKIYYCLSRYYDLEKCRFISRDSVNNINYKSIGRLNLYTYCGNDPINRWDA